MKLFIFIFLTCKLLLAGDFTIQLMSYKDESSLTPYFMKMVKKTGFEPRMFEEAGYKKISIGSFKTEAEALRVCNTLKCIPDDVFVRVFPDKMTTPHAVNEETVDIKLQEVKCPECPKLAPCSSFKTNTSRRSCEISESFKYLRNSGYYRFSSEGNLGLSKHSR